jgi:hypothetical protein
MDELFRTIKENEQENLIKIKKIENFKSEEPLMININKLINNRILGNKEKQMAIENLGLNYDLYWFKNEIDNSLDPRAVLLQDIYKKIDKGFNYILKPFIKHNWLSFEKLYNTLQNGKGINKNLNIFLAILIILLLGNDNFLSTSFKILMELITKSENKMVMNSTELIFNMGNKLIKFSLYRLEKEVKNKRYLDTNYRLYHLFRIIIFYNINKFLINMNDTEIF